MLAGNPKALRKFLHRNQNQRFTDKATARLLDTIQIYVKASDLARDDVDGLLEDVRFINRQSYFWCLFWGAFRGWGLGCVGSEKGAGPIWGNVTPLVPSFDAALLDAPPLRCRRVTPLHAVLLARGCI